MTTSLTAPATEKQMYWITKLVDEKAISAELRAEIKDGIHAGFISKTNAGKYLDTLFDKSIPNLKLGAQKELTMVDVGFYKDGEGVVWTVVKAKGNPNKRYAKKVTGKGFIYVAGAINNLTEDMKMSVADIQAYGMETGICANCAALLTDPISIHIGLGTQCGPKLMGKESYSEAKKAAKLAILKAEATKVIEEEAPKSPAAALIAAVQEKVAVEVPETKGGTCANCFRKASEVTFRTDFSGIGGEVCPTCVKLPSIDLSFA
jgi:hypothetical protein